MSLQQKLGLKEPLYLMDGSAFVFRGFYANRTMQRSDGFPTNALFVVARILLRILREEQPRHFVFMLDGKGPNFRHELFPLYKANRDATPEDLIRQLEPIQRLVHCLGLTLHVSKGCEADDCIASLVHKHAKERPVVIVGADKDLRQCLSPGVWLWDPASKEEKLVGAEDFTRETGLLPSQWPDVQALMGDSSDNIPGVPGIGPKTAAKIFADFSSLEDIRDGLDRLPPKLHDKIAPHVEAMFLYRQLTTLRTDFCDDMPLDKLRVQTLDLPRLLSFLQEYELTSLRREVESMARAGLLGQPTEAFTAPPAAKTAKAPQAAQGSLLGLMTPRQSHSVEADCAPQPCDAPAALAAPFAPPPRAQSIDQLPACQDLPLALLPAAVHPALRSSSGHIVALADREWHWEGSEASLATWAAEAGQLIVPDVKALLRAHPAWQAVPLEQWFDMGLAAYLLAPEERDYGWPKLAAHWGSVLNKPEEHPGLLALALGTALAEKLAEQQLAPLYYALELPLVPVLASMEEKGVAVDAAAFRHFLQDVQGELDRLTAEVHKAAGNTFNIRSAQQLGEVLFSTLNLPTAGKTRGGQLSTAQAKLEKLAGRHPVVDAVLEFRKLEKLRSTYLEPLPRLMDSAGRIHTSFNQLATATGRLSSSNPNVQNIPVRGPLGQRMRSCFVAKEQHALVSADYSQVELRVLAHMSRDPVLLEAFRQGQDIHTRTAALIFNLAPEDVLPDQRRNAKTINFGLIYGMGAQKLAQELGISLNEAKEFITNYFEHMGTLKAFYDQVEADAKKHGLVTTLAGRRRLLPDIHSQNGQVFALARRQAINTVIQGSAADIIKLAMLAVNSDEDLRRMGAQLILQVHDELLLEVPLAHAAEAGERVAALMTGVQPGGQSLDVPLLVDWGQGLHWGAAH